MKKPNGDNENGVDKASAAHGRPNGSAAAGADAALGVDPGAAEVARHIAFFLDELAKLRWDRDSEPLLEVYRINTLRAAEMLRRDGPDLALAFRIKHRRSRRLINQLIDVCEADLPPEVG